MTRDEWLASEMMRYEPPTLSDEARERIKRRLLADARQIRLWKASTGILGALLAFMGAVVLWLR